MASSAISQEEFHRMQTQLLDLRTANYTLMEESNRHKNGSIHSFHSFCGHFSLFIKLKVKFFNRCKKYFDQT